MPVPLVLVYDDSDLNYFEAYSWGEINKGSTTVTLELHIWNDKGGGGASSTLTNAFLGLKTLYLSTSGIDLLDEGWVKARCVTYAGAGAPFTTLINGVRIELGSALGVQTIPSNNYAVVEIKIIVPSNAIGEIIPFYNEITGEYV